MGEYDDLIAAANGKSGGGEYDDLIAAANGKGAPGIAAGLAPQAATAPSALKAAGLSEPPPQAPFFSPEGGGTFTQRLGQAGGAINSAIDALSLGGYGALNRLAGDPLSVAKGIHEYRQAHPDLRGWTDAAMAGPLAMELEGSQALGPVAQTLTTPPVKAVAQLADRAIPQAAGNRVAQVARAGLTGAAAAGASSAATAASDGSTLPVILDAAKAGAASGGLLSAGFGVPLAALGMLGDAVMNSKGGQARQFIEANGEGAEVGLRTPGRGGIYDTALKDIGEGSKAEGRAAFRGAKGLLNMHEQSWQGKTGYTGEDYRTSVPAFRKKVADARPEIVEEDVAKPARPPRPVRDEAAARPGAEAKLAEIEAKHQERKGPILQKQAEVDEQVAGMPPRDAQALEDEIRMQLRSAKTQDRARAKLENALKILDGWRDNGTITPGERTQLNDFKAMRAMVKPGTASVAGLDKLIGDLEAKAGTGKVMMPEDEINAVRRYIYGETSLGKTDVRSGAEHPQRAAGNVARETVNEGPYAEVNKDWTEAFKQREIERKGLGLRKRPPSDRDTDVEKIARRDAKAKYARDKASYEAEVARLKAEHLEKVAKAREDYEGKVAEQDRLDEGNISDFEAAKQRAVEERSQLGLSAKPPSEARIDRGKLKRNLLNRTKDTHTAGDEEANIEAFLDERGPAARRFARLPELAVARNELSFGSPGGDLLKIARMDRRHGGPLAPLLNNLGPIQGRWLYGPAREALLAEMAQLRLSPLFQAALHDQGDQ